MARDLIPPPSPAGRPQPAGTPRLVELPPEPTVDQLEPQPPPPPPPKLPPSRFRNRFGFLMGALAGVVVASALVLAAVLAVGSGTADEGLEPNWSKWQPTDTSVTGGAAQIAAKVGAEYRHPDGKQLVLVTGRELPLPVALRPATGNISVFNGTGVLYQLNGLGPNNSIKGGTPSAARLKLLHREALELALYTFRYLPEVEMVVALLPPPPPKEGADAETATNGVTPAPVKPGEQTALFYLPGDLKPQLQVPLGVTVPAKAPTTGTLGGSEAKTIEALTQSNLFLWDVPEPGNLLVLDRPS